MGYHYAMVLQQSMYGYLKESITDSNANKIIYFGKKISAFEMLQTIETLAAFLLDKGIKKGDIVGIALPNTPEAIFALYAVNAIGAVANLIHPKISESAFCALIKKTRTKALFIYDKLYKNRKQCLGDIPVVICSVSGYMPYPLKAFFALSEPVFAPGATRFYDTLTAKKRELPQPDGTKPAVYIHSGGTTGEPKTVVLSSEAINRLVDALLGTVYVTGEPLKSDDVMLMMLPIFHGFGLGVCVHAALSRIQTALLPRFKASLANKMVKKYGVTHLAGVPAMFAKMLAQKNFAGEHLKKINRIFCGGDRLDPKTKKQFDWVLKSFGSPAELTEGYGLSEASAVFSVSLIGETKVGCQGRPLMGNAIKAVDETGATLPAGKSGEFLVSSPSLMMYYLDDSEATAQVMVKDGGGKLWLKTGDIGYIDKDGGIHFVERAKRSLKIAGENIFPSEIETVVNSLPEIDECCAVRVKRQGKPYTKLYITIKEKARPDAALEKRIRAQISQNLIKYAVPQEIVAVDKLARTPFGKIDYLWYENNDSPKP